MGLETALRALQSQQAGIDVTSHNVANANTPGFSRQSAELVATRALDVVGAAGQIGTGVTVTRYQRARDAFLDVQYRLQDARLHQARVTQDTLDQVETILNEPSASGISSLLDRFFDSWATLADNPSDLTARAAVVQQAASMAAALNGAASALTVLQGQLDSSVNLRVTEVNDLAKQIASLNQQIVQTEIFGQAANDLRDRRDLVIDRLSGLAHVTTTEAASGSVDIFIGAHALVSGINTDPLATTPTGPGGSFEVRFSSDNSLATIASGELRGLLDARDVNLPSYLSRLNAIGSSLITTVNQVHAAGYGTDGNTGRDFFVGTDAATIAVNPVLVADPRLVAAADAPAQPGNNAVALAVAQLHETLSPSPEDAYAALVTSLGIDGRSSRDLADNQQLMVNFLSQRRQSVSGVSLDQEAVDLTRYQRAYQAAARVITALDEMLDKLINDTGIVGR